VYIHGDDIYNYFINIIYNASSVAAAWKEGPEHLFFARPQIYTYIYYYTVYVYHIIYRYMHSELNMEHYFFGGDFWSKMWGFSPEKSPKL